MRDVLTLIASPDEAPAGRTGTLVVGLRARVLADDVRALLPPGLGAGIWEAMVECVHPGDTGAGTCTFAPAPGNGAGGGDGQPHQVAVALLPQPCSRHGAPARPHAVTNVVRAHAPRKGGLLIVAALERPDDALAVACAVARAFPAYDARTGPGTEERAVALLLVPPGGQAVAPAAAAEAMAAVLLAGRLVDAPTPEVDTVAMVAQARAIAAEVGAGIEVIEGEALRRRGFGGLWSVGKAAEAPPALVTLSLGGAPRARDRKLGGKGGRGGRSKAGAGAGSVVWVGKGIVYDSGGLSIKPRADMVGMKGDMAGAAAVLAAFRAAARLSWPGPLHAVLCLAENAVGPRSYRNDDVIRLYSGKTVEVNNTDAEGRLVLGDGVAWAVRRLDPRVVVDIATLTGAQLTATGRRHAAIVCSDEELEAACVRAGRLSGDLVHPLPYCPEFFRREFKSRIADMRNSAADRANAGTAAAGQFVACHLAPWDGPWLHIDIAGPAASQERATGFGVALLLTLFSPSAAAGPSPARAARRPTRGGPP